jgi:hypothetical protein
MASEFDATNAVWGEDLQDIFFEEPYVYMDNRITLMFDEKGEASLLMPIYYNTPLEIILESLKEIEEYFSSL